MDCKVVLIVKLETNQLHLNTLFSYKFIIFKKKQKLCLKLKLVYCQLSF
ncbi:hypothetical protein FHR29_004632 [Sphingobacterium sp. JUb56]|nr:hypothetical protein [Sphingobacterium sp. JUb56]